ncbi:Polyketide cyclase / dehydrase and lipid transport [Pedococcus dokdonensis]|uniref:Polyketide cyclase / dehydrase and lipid transport n=2 Tax=Pedococcus TaxID=2805645 RepID=A0A1H0UA37_9MICO|nr:MULTISPECIES: SRPBCC family protein [Pedococcus]TPG16833.1 SRPBCC family protein [Pedococcus bigeumensis]SDP63033.1 Polyketide cyclase / dehydrase and lipid transport [Pedococcus dokdonensis]
MAPVAVTMDVNRAAADVFAYATDPTRFHEWQNGVVDGHMEATGAPKVGDRCLTSRRIGGAVRSSTSTVTHIEPPHRWGVHGIDGPIRAIVDVTVEPLDDARSRLTIAVDFEGHGIGKLLVPLMVRRQAAKEMPANLTALKQHLEEPGRSEPQRPDGRHAGPEAGPS